MKTPFALVHCRLTAEDVQRIAKRLGMVAPEEPRPKVEALAKLQECRVRAVDAETVLDAAPQK